MILVLILVMAQTWAGTIRTLEMDNTKSEAIYLCMGRSTVLRFKDRPKKVVSGNRNYFNLEFLGNDVTIQPKRAVESNLFVYGEYHHYTFNLKFLSGCRYDDLVKVSPPRPKAKKGVSVVLDDSLRVFSNPPIKARIGRNLWIVELTFFYQGENKLDTRELKARLDRGKQWFVREKDFLQKGEVMRARILFRGENKGPLNLTVNLGKKGAASLKLPWGTQ